ncbi:HEAT repeat domain-containing protein [Accumulibacter sp.]|jgi:hypothetical protein|uniref:HEAT repeat domain-containing protein n=1 Tax=Accumulibacter regalis TaxID=522306 RepID=C7RKC2_ACCRE|nr:HEAT repeat domain-containing protein [Accumulibacter sp.]MBN8497615.1 HEAT repeat domain-containing protein [Accumulibacter sp.]
MTAVAYGQMVAELVAGQVTSLMDHALSEAVLRRLARELDACSAFKTTIPHLLSQFARNVPRTYDWNCGSLLQHAPAEPLFSSIPADGALRTRLRESIGLTWCLGQFLLRDQRIIDFLEETVALADNPQSWWRAAFSLERIGLVEAVSYLKAALKYQGVPDLDLCLNSLGNEKSRIGILLQSDSRNLEKAIIPRLRAVVGSRSSISGTKEDLLAAVWLLARLNHHDQHIRAALKRLARDQDYEIQFYSLHAISRLGSPHFVDDLLEFLRHDTPHLRVIAAEGLGRIDLPRSAEGLRQRLRLEINDEVVGTITESLYALTNYYSRQNSFIARTVGASENGMIVDKGDKWYGNPSIYHEFSACQDPENVCFGLLQHLLEGAEIVNPIDLGSGTGRLAWYFLEHFAFEGQMFCLDVSEEMCRFLNQRATRECIGSDRIVIRQGAIEAAASVVGEQSSSLAACRTFGLLPTGYAIIMPFEATEGRHVPLHRHRP